MNETAAPITVALRIPGTWSHPRELAQRLPLGCRLTGEALVLPDATQVEFGAMAAIEELAGSPMHNPFGRLKLVSMRDIAETN